MKYTVRTATADLDIEGANISRSEDEGEMHNSFVKSISSRLRMTVVVEKDEEESLAKTMTMKVNWDFII